jgi:hypothetical protein
MSKRWLVTFSGSDYDATTERIVADGPRFGADEVLVFDDAWLDTTEFRTLNRWLWDHPGQRYPDGRTRRRGYGWYAWKSFVIQYALDYFADMGDIVFYTDGDTFPVADFSVCYDTTQRDGAMLFVASGQSNHRWCKRDCYVVMGQDAEPMRYAYVPAGNARYMGFLKGPWKPRQLLQEWLAYSVNPTATTFDPSMLRPELPEFTEHRTEQAILTLLAYRYGYKLHRECCEGGEGWPEDRDMYGQIFSQVHQRNGAPPTGSKFAGRWDKTGRIGDL